MNVHLSDTAPDRENPVRLLDELRQAVEAELAATQAQAATFRAEVTAGALLGNVDGGHIYVFLLSTVLPISDDLPGELHIGGQTYPCRIVAVAGLRVTLLLATAPARFIERATLVAQPWRVLESLHGALQRRSREPTQGIGLSAALFSGQSAGIAAIPQDGTNGEHAVLNETQQEALATALSHTVAAIVGPAHSGKTHLLGNIAAACLAAGNRVLVLAPSNDAVDSILRMLAERAAPAVYADGGLLRNGCSPDPDLQRGYPLLAPENAERRLKAELSEELAAIAAERGTLVEQDQAFSVLQKAVDLAQRAAVERDAVQAEVDALLERQEVATTEPGESKGVKYLKERWEHVWQQAKRLARGSHRGVRRAYHDNAERQRQAAYGLAQRLAEAQRRLAESQAAAERLETSVRQQLAQYELAVDGVEAAVADTKTRLRSLDEKQESTAAALNAVALIARARARLVASTVTQALVAETFDPESFDVVLVDDAHGVPLAHLFWAAGLARSRLIVTTEETALQPWHCAPQAVAGRWLGRSFVAHLASIGAQAAPWVANLNERHALQPAIAQAVSRWLLDAGAGTRARLLQPARQREGPHRSIRRRLPVRGHTAAFSDALKSESPVHLADTGPLKPWNEAVPQEGRVSPASALTAIALAEKIGDAEPGASLALVTPYAAQARLLIQLARDREIAPSLGIFAPPCLPRRAADIVIFDTVETPGAFTWSALDDSRPDSEALAFFSGVLSQARQRIVIVAHWKHVRDTFGARALLRRILGEAAHAKWAFSAAELVPSERAGSLPRMAAASELASETRNKQSGGTAGWRLLLEDLQAAEKTISIWSPHLALATVERCLSCLPSELLERGAVRLITLPHGQRSGQGMQSAEARLAAEQMGVVVEERSTLAANLVVVDDRVAWDCTFPPLGAGSQGAALRRVESDLTARLLCRLLSAPGSGTLAEEAAAFLPFTGTGTFSDSADALPWDRAPL